MDNLQIPDGYQRLMPYLIVSGAAQFNQFVQRIFGATEKQIVRRDTGGIMHGEVVIGDSTIMFADSTAEYPVQTAGLYLHVVSADDTYRQSLDAGATSVMEPTDQDHGRTAGIKDPVGNVWWLVSAG